MMMMVLPHTAPRCNAISYSGLAWRAKLSLCNPEQGKVHTLPALQMYVHVGSGTGSLFSFFSSDGMQQCRDAILASRMCLQLHGSKQAPSLHDVVHARASPKCRSPLAERHIELLACKGYISGHYMAVGVAPFVPGW